MSSELRDEVDRYISYFRSEHEKLLDLEYPLHSKLLVVSMLSSLAEGRYPCIRSDKTKFINLIENYSEWPDATSISVSQLELKIKKRPCTTEYAVRTEFVEDISRRCADLHGSHSTSRILFLEIDPTPEDLLPEYQTKEEKKLVEGAKHSSLLYIYRCKLVHEFRKPGHGFEVDRRFTSPYYHWMANPHGENDTFELVYPTQWFLNLPLPILTGLETHYISAGINPYDSYNFGSPW